MTICVIGDLVEDVVVQLNGTPRRGTDTAATISRHRGGSAANVAVAAAAAGSSARFIGSVGSDPTGDRLIAELRTCGVEFEGRRHGITGSIVVLVEPDGERSFLSDRGTCVQLSPSDSRWLDDATWLHVPAYSLFGGPLAETTLRLIGDAIDQSVEISISTSSVAVLEEYGPQAFARLIDEVRPSWLIANRSEADVLTSAIRGGLNTTIVVTDGPKPTIVIDRNGHETLRLLPSAISEVVDTTGAGDAFTGGMISALATGMGPSEAIDQGHRLARRSLRSHGADLSAGD